MAELCNQKASLSEKFKAEIDLYNETIDEKTAKLKSEHLSTDGIKFIEEGKIIAAFIANTFPAKKYYICRMHKSGKKIVVQLLPIYD
jgi:hypothetical protein